MNSEDAQILALRALTFLAEDQQRIEGFLRMTGTQPADLRQFAQTEEGLAAILDYLLGNERLLLEFTGSEQCPDDAPARARRALPGNQQSPGWN
ncbi:DUF3572 family protein [Pyruvatibacter sp.]|uniref:DUF3572 family protein n=1 Tax=Pyruvatibacter sp. TaxID=1981328 RepID=UPI0032EDB0A4